MNYILKQLDEWFFMKIVDLIFLQYSEIWFLKNNKS